MVKSKYAALAVSASLVAALGLGACGGQAASSSASASSSSSEATSSSMSSSAASSSDTSASNTSSSSAATADDKTIVSWDGLLTDGSIVSYMNSEDGKQAALSVTKPNSEDEKTWVGAAAINGDKITITDDTTKEAITFTLTTLIENGAMAIEIEGYGTGALVPFTAADYKTLEEFQKTVDDFSQVVSWDGALEDGSLVSFMNSEDGKQAALSISQLGSTETKTWMGSAAVTDDGKVTITDSSTKDTVTIKVNSTKEDGTAEIEIEGYGKGTVVQFTAADYQLIGQLEKALTDAAKEAK